MKNKNLIVKEIIRYFADKKNISTIYLFGSFAKNFNRKDSDIDIAVLFKKNLDKLERFNLVLEFVLELENILGEKIDIIDIENADPFFIHQVMLGKIIVIDKDTERRVSFEVDKRRTFFDMQPFYELYYSQSVKRLKEKATNG
ncbi:MAG: type VII toxin-antitoxin system MntA family adenylyltransferase antitoxin [Candidatus Humimicrobiaceae bacterium]